MNEWVFTEAACIWIYSRHGQEFLFTETFKRSAERERGSFLWGKAAGMFCWPLTVTQCRSYERVELNFCPAPPYMPSWPAPGHIFVLCLSSVYRLSVCELYRRRSQFLTAVSMGSAVFWCECTNVIVEAVGFSQKLQATRHCMYRHAVFVQVNS